MDGWKFNSERYERRKKCGVWWVSIVGRLKVQTHASHNRIAAGAGFLINKGDLK